MRQQQTAAAFALTLSLFAAACAYVDSNEIVPGDLGSASQALSLLSCDQPPGSVPPGAVCSSATGDATIRSACFVALGGDTFRKEIAQTFTTTTVNYAGRVRLLLRRLGVATTDTAFSLEVRQVDANGRIPTNTATTFALGSLSTAQLNALPIDSDTQVEITLNSGDPDPPGTPAELSKQLQTTKTYALVLRIAQPGILALGVACHPASPYADGQAWTRQLRRTGTVSGQPTYSAPLFIRDSRDLAFVFTLGNGALTNPTPPSISPGVATLAVGNSLAFTATSGTSPFSYSIASGGGSLVGSTYTAPATSGTAVVRVTDAYGLTSDATVTINGAPVINPVEVTLTVGNSTAFSASGGVGSYTFSVVTAGGGTFSGSTYTAPATAGTATVRVTDSLGNTSDATVTIDDAAPAMTAPVSVDMSGIQGVPVVRTINATNSAPVGANPLSVTATATSGFSVTGNTCSDVAAQTACTITLAWTPTDVGAVSGSVTLTPNAGTAQTISLTGTVVAGVSNFVATDSPSTAFSAATVNSAASPDVTVNLQNQGNIAGSYAAPAISGTNAGDFAMVNNGCTSIAVNGPCSVGIRFTPQAMGARSAAVTIGVTLFALSGLGTLASFAVTGPPAAFANTNINTSASPNSTLTVTNNGNVAGTPWTTALSVTGANIGDFGVVSDDCLNQSILAGGTCQVAFSFTPTAFGSRSASVAVLGTGYALSGTGQGPSFAVMGGTAASQAFNSATVNVAATPDVAITVQNGGDASGTPWTTSPTLGGSNPTNFSVSSDGCRNAVVTAGGSCAVTFRFIPTAAGSRSATTTVLGTALTFTGTGIAPLTYATLDPAYSSATLSLGNLRANAYNNWYSAMATIGKTTGKWYWEVQAAAGGSGNPVVVGFSASYLGVGQMLGSNSASVGYASQNGTVSNNNILATLALFSSGATIGVNVDVDAGTVTFVKNGVQQNTVTYAKGAIMYPAASMYGSGTATFNFGATPFTYAPLAGYNAGIYN